MRWFPQLACGSMAQYPVRKRRVLRTAMNSSPDGRSIRLADPGAAITEWELQYSELTDDELSLLEGFFIQNEGRLGSFTFLDPVGNLLCWSEKPEDPAWEKGPMLAIDTDFPGPERRGGACRIRNTGAGPQQVQQVVAAPAGLYYCFSVYARSDSGGSLKLLRGIDECTHRVDSVWRRLTHSGRREGGEEQIRFGIELQAGQSVELFGFQAEPQTGASQYKRTTARGGVYPDARFGDDKLSITTTGANQNSCKVRVIHAERL